MQLDFPKIQPLTFCSLAADGLDAANPGKSGDATVSEIAERSPDRLLVRT